MKVGEHDSVSKKVLRFWTGTYAFNDGILHLFWCHVSLSDELPVPTRYSIGNTSSNDLCFLSNGYVGISLIGFSLIGFSHQK